MQPHEEVGEVRIQLNERIVGALRTSTFAGEVMFGSQRDRDRLLLRGCAGTGTPTVGNPPPAQNPPATGDASGG